MGTKIYSLTQCSLTVIECDWHILAGNDKRINSHCLTRIITRQKKLLVLTLIETTHDNSDDNDEKDGKQRLHRPLSLYSQGVILK